MLSNGKSDYYLPSFEDQIGNDGFVNEGEWRKNIGKDKYILFHTSLLTYQGRSTDIGKYVQENIKINVNSPLGSAHGET